MGSPISVNPLRVKITATSADIFVVHMARHRTRSAVVCVEHFRLAIVLNKALEEPYIVAPATRHASFIQILYQERIVGVRAVPRRVAALTLSSATIVEP